MAATKEDYIKFFKAADKDKSGSLTLDELSPVLKNGGYSEKQIKDLFEEADYRSDGKLTEEEFVVIMGKGTAEQNKEALLRRLFKQFDKDNNGTIDRGELKKVFQELGKEMTDCDLQRMISLGDSDQSATLDYEEFIEQVFGSKK